MLRRGRRRAAESVVVHVIDRDDELPARVAVVASRRVGTAVRRNRAKRVLRAAAESCALPPGADVALVARASTAELSSETVASDLRSVVEQMFDSMARSGGSPS